MTINIPNGAVYIISVLEENGFEAYVVGGCVRDSLCGLVPKDWDICTNAKPEEVKLCFKQGEKIIETGIQHGTVTAIINSELYEVTTYRVDGEYLDNRHPKDVEFVSSLKEDLSRRDFTVNGMAYNQKEGLIDYFNGCDDLRRKLIRCVGNPDIRFKEDALRIMRALRFASTYDFNIAEPTKLSIKNHKGLLRNISAERINNELCRLLCGQGVGHILNEYSEVFCEFMPELKLMISFNQHNPHNCLDLWQHTIKCVASTPYDVIIRLALLFHDIGKPISYGVDEWGIGHFHGHERKSSDMAILILKRLKFDKETITQVKELILYHHGDIQPTNKNVKRWLNKIGEIRLRQLMEVKRADVMAKSAEYRSASLSLIEEVIGCIDDVIKQKQCFSLKDLAVNGRDLMDNGVAEGKSLGIILNWLMDMVIDEKIENHREELLKAASSREGHKNFS